MRAPSRPVAPATKTVCMSVPPGAPSLMVPSCLPILLAKFGGRRAASDLEPALSRLVPLRGCSCCTSSATAAEPALSLRVKPAEPTSRPYGFGVYLWSIDRYGVVIRMPCMGAASAAQEQRASAHTADCSTEIERASDAFLAIPIRLPGHSCPEARVPEARGHLPSPFEGLDTGADKRNTRSRRTCSAGRDSAVALRHRKPCSPQAALR